MLVIWKVKYAYLGRKQEHKEIEYLVLTKNKDIKDAEKVAEKEIKATATHYQLIGIDYIGMGYQEK